jgi:predicted TIM-barrel fold metal-dependent hydrolase
MWLMSGDGHMTEPEDLWSSQLPAHLLERAGGKGPAYTRLPDDERWRVLHAIDGKKRVLAPEYARYVKDGVPVFVHPAHEDEYDFDLVEVIRPAETDQRLRDLELDGVWAESIHPNAGNAIFRTDDTELAIACARIYNDFMAERFLTDRLYANAIIPIEDIDLAVAEIERAASLGYRGIELPQSARPDRPYFLERYNPIWEAASAHRLVINMHVGGQSGDQALPPSVVMGDIIKGPSYAGDPVHEQRSALFRPMVEAVCLGALGGGAAFQARVTIPQLVAGGVLDCYPDLHFFFVEVGGRWLADLMLDMDDIWLGKTGVRARQVRLSFFKADGTRVPQIDEYELDAHWLYPLRPSEYVRRQVHVGFADDWVALRNIEITGSEPLIWGSDYPHYEGCWPASQQRISEMLERVPLTPDQQVAVFGGNLAKLYDIPAPA